MVIECISNGKRKTISLEEYLNKEKDCLCGAKRWQICLCSNEKTVEDHLRILEEGGFGRARIINKKEYLKSKEALLRKRPILLRNKKNNPKPF